MPGTKARYSTDVFPYDAPVVTQRLYADGYGRDDYTVKVGDGLTMFFEDADAVRKFAFSMLKVVGMQDRLTDAIVAWEEADDNDSNFSAGVELVRATKEMFR